MGSKRAPSRKRRSPGLHANEKAAKRLRGENAWAGLTLKHPSSRHESHPWPASKLNALAMPLEEYGWGKLVEDLMESRGWKIHRPCAVYKTDNGTTEPDICVCTSDYEALLKGRRPTASPEKDQELVCQGIKKLPSHACMLMAHAAIKRDDWVEHFIKNRAHFSGKGKQYRIASIAGSEVAAWKCNISEAFRREDFYPTAYVLPREKKLLIKELTSGQASYWIAKPNDDCGGNGITVWSHDDEGLKKIVQQSVKSGKRSVVQRYLHDPLLLGPFKFHIRIHLLIASISPLKAFVHRGGQVLCGTRPYTLSKKTLGKKFDGAVHLTNQCFNAKPDNKHNYMRAKRVIGRGQQITIPQLEQYLQRHVKGFSKENLWKQILYIGKRSAEHIAYCRSVTRHANKVDVGQHFELFGMDLMLDKNLKVWMCEVNKNPGLSYPDRKILGDPNPDYAKELNMCRQVLHDTLEVLGIDAGRRQSKGSLTRWYEVPV